MSTIKNGDTVKVHYTGQLDDGSVFDSSLHRAPLEFTIGQGQLIPGFEKAVVGLSAGDTTTANIPCAEAYGEQNPDLILVIDKEQLPDSIEPEVGQRLQLSQPEGEPIPVHITKVEDNQVTIDANHPLAGKDLTFNIEIIEVA